MERRVKLFILSAMQSPGGPPQPAQAFTVEAGTLDALSQAAREKIAADGYRVRSISFGPDGLVAYAEEAGE